MTALTLVEVVIAGGLAFAAVPLSAAAARAMATSSTSGTLDSAPSPEPSPAAATAESAPPVVRNGKRPSMALSALELRALCREHRVGDGRWRSKARKTAMVEALQAKGVML